MYQAMMTNLMASVVSRISGYSMSFRTPKLPKPVPIIRFLPNHTPTFLQLSFWGSPFASPLIWINSAAFKATDIARRENNGGIYSGGPAQEACRGFFSSFLARRRLPQADLRGFVPSFSSFPCSYLLPRFQGGWEDRAIRLLACGGATWRSAAWRGVVWRGVAAWFDIRCFRKQT